MWRTTNGAAPMTGTGGSRACAGSAPNSTPCDQQERPDMDFTFDARTEELRAQVREFMDERVFPAESVLAEQIEELRGSWRDPPIIFELQREARARGLWNLFLPHR